MAKDKKPSADRENALAQFKVMVCRDEPGLSDQFLAEFLTQASNRRLARLAMKGDEGARRRILTRLRARRVEARFWSYLRKTLDWETKKLLREIERHHVMETATLNEPIAEDCGEDHLSRIPDITGTMQAESELAASLEESVENSRLWQALASLSPRQHQILQLLFVADLSEDQAAKALGITQQAVNKAKLAGLRRLKRAIQNGEGGG